MIGSCDVCVTDVSSKRRRWSTKSERCLWRPGKGSWYDCGEVVQAGSYSSRKVVLLVRSYERLNKLEAEKGRYVGWGKNHDYYLEQAWRGPTAWLAGSCIDR